MINGTVEMKELHSKVLTKNDTGETGGHQGGIVVPKGNLALLNFFPTVDIEEFNPQVWIHCEDPDGVVWKMRYVYYNGKIFSPPKSTRNEYRITHMTKFFSKWNAKAEDSLEFSATSKSNHYQIQIKKSQQQNDCHFQQPKPIVLRGWDRVY